MSFWLNLIPKLNSPNPRTPTQVPPSSPYLDHHLLPDHDDLDTYEGVVRDALFKNQHPTLSSASASDNKKLISVKSMNASMSNKSSDKIKSSSTSPDSNKNESNQLVVMDGSNVDESSGDKINTDADNSIERTKEVTTPTATIYSSALSAIVILGCSFLILNLIICLRLLYKEDRANHGLKRAGTQMLGSGGRSRKSKRRSSTLTSLNDQVLI